MHRSRGTSRTKKEKLEVAARRREENNADRRDGSLNNARRRRRVPAKDAGNNVARAGVQ